MFLDAILDEIFMSKLHVLNFVGLKLGLKGNFCIFGSEMDLFCKSVRSFLFNQEQSLDRLP